MPFDLDSAPTKRTDSISGRSSTNVSTNQGTRNDPHHRDSARMSNSGGFQNRPERRSDSSGLSRPVVSSPPQIRETPRIQRRDIDRRVRTPIAIPWRIIIPICAVIAVLAFLYIFRNEITAFLSQVLQWIIMIIIILVVLRLLIGGRRRW